MKNKIFFLRRGLLAAYGMCWAKTSGPGAESIYSHEASDITAVKDNRSREQDIKVSADDKLQKLFPFMRKV